MADEATPPSYLTTAYTELCRSNQGLHEFRMKLLGILPIASVIGLVAIGKGLPPALPPTPASIAIGFVGIFSGLFTLALFGYEIRGILMCHDLSLAGANLEKKMGIEGQFRQCDEDRYFGCYDGRYKRPIAQAVNSKVTSVGVYSLVFGAWFVVGLHYTFGIHPTKCVISGVVLAFIVAIFAALFLRLVTKKPPRPPTNA